MGSVRRATSFGAKPIDALLPKLEIETAPNWPIVELCEEIDRAQWAATVYSVMRTRRACADDGRLTRNRIYKVLSILAEHGTVTHPMPPILWRRLFQLAKLCANEADWSAPTGPLMGASNDKLELQTWGITNARRTLRQLANWGLIIPFCPRGNGKRSYKRGGSGPIGSGWSLAPLLLMVDTLESLAATELELQALRVELPLQIQARVYAIAALIKPFTQSERWAFEASIDLDRLRSAKRKTAKGSLNQLQAILVEATNLLLRVEDNASDAGVQRDGGRNMSTRADAGVHHQYSDSINRTHCNGSAVLQRSCANATTRRASHAPCPAPATGKDVFGISRSGFTWDEAPLLFPFHIGLIELEAGPTAGTATVLGRLIGVSTSTVAYAERCLGRDAASVCLLMTGQLEAQGEIIKTTEAYMRGLMKKAAAGELNIGHSLFGRRMEHRHSKAPASAVTAPDTPAP